MSTNLEYRERERQRKREKRRQASEAQREKERQKNEGHSLLEGQHEKFVAAVRKREILAATKVKMSRSEKKKNKNTYDISFIKRVTRTFLELSRCSRAKQGQRNVQKKRDRRSKLLFCSLDILLLFTGLGAFAA